MIREDDHVWRWSWLRPPRPVGRRDRRCRGRATATGLQPPTGPTRSRRSSARPLPASLSWSRSATAACSARRSPSTAAVRRSWRRTSRTPRSVGLRAQLCGDAHLSNFGVFAAPDRDLVFDLNDFDETLPGPWEWDVKRLAASVAVAGRELGIARARAARRRARHGEGLPVDDARLRGHEDDRRLVRAARRGRRVRSARANTRQGLRAQGRGQANRQGALEGQPARVRQADPRGRRPAADRQRPAADRAARGAASPEDDRDARGRCCQVSCATTAARSRPDRRQLLDLYTLVHMAHKVVGVGSVGTRAWIVLLLGPRRRRPALPAGQGGRAVRARAVRRREPLPNPRPARGRGPAADAGGERRLPGLAACRRRRPRGATDYYVRQLWDWKASATIETHGPEPARRVRQDLRLDARARARPLGRPGRDRRLPRRR